MGEYQALYRAWRPESFKDVYGQDAVVRTLKHQVASGRVGHAYLFCGSRGTGKTTTARIFARAINCLNPSEGEPCGECEVCRALMSESSLDLVEIDAASNNSVDEIRLLRERIAFPPTLARKKVYIIDEVHQLSRGAFNALLKTLEEPPEHAVFILATTEPQKLLATVISRCQRYDFKRIRVKDISARLSEVLAGIGRNAEKEAIDEIASAADGGMRDALSLLDMCLSYTDGTVSAALVREVLGTSGREFMFRFTDCLEKGDIAGAFACIEETIEDGHDPETFLSETADHLRLILLAQMTGEQVEEIAQLTHETAQRLQEQAGRFEKQRLTRAMDLFMRAASELKSVSNPRTLIELTAFRAANISKEPTVDGLTERVEALEKQLRDGVIVKSEAPPAAPRPQSEQKAPSAAAEEAPQQSDSELPADSDEARFKTALAEFMKENVPMRVFLRQLRFVKTEEDRVYANLPLDNTIQKPLLEMKAASFEKHLASAFGRPMKLVIGIDEGSGRKGRASGADLSRTFDVFGRENVELVD